MSVFACFSASSAVSHSNKCSLLTFVLYIVFIIEFNVIIALLGRKLISNINEGLVFSRDGDKIWQCRNCGHIVIGKEAPKVCPVCAHPQSYFEIKKENY